MKVVVNRCYGGFGLSKKAILKLAEMGNEIAIKETNGEYFKEDKHYHSYGYEFDTLEKRTDPDLVKVVEELGKEANGACAKLEMIDVPMSLSDLYIDEYDGWECVSEKHMSW